MFRPSLREGPPPSQPQGKEGDIHIRRDYKNPREDRGEFIDYEEVE
ncbi:MAG: hypothetical protein AAGJ18_29780 [Bacteroidota bacterium]